MAKVFADNAVLDFTVSGVYLMDRDRNIDDAAGNNNGHLDPGETAGLTVLLKNYGTQAANNTSGTLSDNSPDVSIGDNYGFWGLIIAGDSIENLLDRFTITASPTAVVGSVVDFALIVSANRYIDTVNFSIVIGGKGNDYVTHDCGNVKLSVTRYGTLGYMSAYAPNPGDGFCYPVTSASHLFYGTLAAGNSASYCVDRFFKGGTCDDDWHTSLVPEGSARMYEPGPVNYDEFATARFDDSGHPSTKGIVGEQRSWAYNDPAANNFVTTEFTLRNTGLSTVAGMYAALFMDFDVGLATANQGATDPGRKLAWLFQSTPYVGVAILNPPRSTPAANLSLVSHKNYVYPLNGLPDSMIVKFMNGTIQQPTTDTVYDWSMCCSSGPFTLNPSDTFVAAFAILGADDLAGLQTSADTAYERYWGAIGTSEQGGPVRRSSFELYPSVSRRRVFTLAYNLATSAVLKVKVYNALGQLVRDLDFGERRGRDEVMINLGPVPQGIYFIQVDNGSAGETRKVILCN